jgi:hypothetical protein
MRIYIAATYARAAEMKIHAQRMRDEGHEVTSECWHDGTEEERRQEYEEWNRGRWYDDNEPVTFEQWSAAQDAQGIRNADMVVMASDTMPGHSFLSMSTGGRHFELGLACGMGGKYLIVVGEPENVFQHMPIIQCLSSWNAFFDALPIYEHAHRATWNLRKDALRSGV